MKDRILRKALEEEGLIETSKGFGYNFVCKRFAVEQNQKEIQSIRDKLDALLDYLNLEISDDGPKLVVKH